MKGEVMKEKGNTEVKDNELVSVSEAAKIRGVKPPAIYQMLRTGRLQAVQTKPYRFLRQDVEDLATRKRSTEAEVKLDPKEDLYAPFGSITWEFDECFKLLDLFHDPKYIGDPLKYYTKKQYAVSNKGRIIDLTRRREIAQSYAAHDYHQSQLLTAGGKMIAVLLHRIVAYVWCPNGKLKDEVHHINGDIHDNSAANLIFLTGEEHAKAHRLMREKNQKEYNRFIKEMQKDNAWQDDLRFIFDPDDDSGLYHYVYITKSDYDDLVSGVCEWKDIKNIKGEFVGW